MNGRGWVALASREFRGSAGRMVFFAACLSVGVAAVVSVAGISRALDDGVRAQARQLLAADIAVESGRPVPAETIDAIAGLPGARRAETREFPSVVSGPTGESVLCEIKAVTGGYPFYGDLVLDPPGTLEAALGDDRVVVGPEVLTRLGTEIGGTIRLGASTYTVAGTIVKEPDRIGVSFTLGPRVFVSLAGLERSGLVGLGSRIEHRVLVALAPGATVEDVESAAATIRAAISDPTFVEVETYVEAQPALRRGLDRVDRFLGLIALLSLLVGGIGVAQAVRAWLAGRLDAIAVLRALGARPREVLALYLGQTVVLGALGSVVGAIAGSIVARALPTILGGILPIEVVVGWQPAAMGRGIALGIGVAVLFALRPLADVLRVPPVRVMRRDADPLPVDRRVAALLAAVLVVGVAAIASFQAGSVVRGVQFSAGLLVSTALLAAGAWTVVRVVGRAPREFGNVSLRHGLAALARPGAGTLGAVVALGLGVLTVVGMALVQQRLSAQLDAELPSGAPTVFLVDIQPDQWDGVRDVLEQADAHDLDSVEVVVARLRSIDDVPVSDLVPADGQDSGRRRWVLTREQRLTSMATLPAGNVIVEGELWSHPDRAEVSIERDFAIDLGAGLGSTVTFDVQGVPLDLYVSSIRTVEWETFAINFFLVVEPGVLDEAPRFRIAAARLEAEAEQPVQDRLATAYPNVTLLRLREVLEKVMSILEQVGFGVRLLGAFTVLAGIAILAGAVSAGAVRRAREVALYKTLGMTRLQVISAFAVEYALVGVVAGTIGVVGAVVLAWAVVRFGFEMDWGWTPGVYAAAVGVTTALSVLAGLAASVRALSVRPLDVLRRET